MPTQKLKMKILHLGCGMNKKPGSFGIDINPKSKADYIHDLNKFPYPFHSNYFDMVIADNILEHLDDIPKVLLEINRICKDKARLLVTTGHFSSLDSFTDPTHKHFFTTRTFDYFIEGTDLSKFQYTKHLFKKIKVILGPVNSKGFISRIILALINRHQILYEKRFAFIFPVGTIYFELEIVKKWKK